VVSGAARSYFLNNEGMEFTWKFHFNDTDASFENLFLVDYQSFLTQTPSYLSFEAINDLEVIELRYESLQLLFKEVPKAQEITRRFRKWLTVLLI